MTAYTIINVGTDKVYAAIYNRRPAKYNTERGAKAACTRLSRQDGTDNWKVVTFKEGLEIGASLSA